MQIIQFPIHINNNTITSNAISIDVNTSKETVNTQYIKSTLAQYIMTKNTYAALSFFSYGTIKFNYKVLQHIRKFVQQFPDSQFNGNMQLHYYILEKFNIVIYGVSFIDNHDNIVFNRTQTVINMPTIDLDDMCDYFDRRNPDMNNPLNFIAYVKMYMNTQTLYYMPLMQKVVDYSITTTYKGNTQTTLYFEDGTHKLFYNTAFTQILTLLLDLRSMTA